LGVRVGVLDAGLEKVARQPAEVTEPLCAVEGIVGRRVEDLVASDLDQVAEVVPGGPRGDTFYGIVAHAVVLQYLTRGRVEDLECVFENAARALCPGRVNLKPGVRVASLMWRAR
jgi:hypothetical protein